MTTGQSFSILPANVSFVNLRGTNPSLTYDNFFFLPATDQAVNFEIEGDMPSSLQFDAIIMSGIAGDTNLGFGVQTYVPLSYGVPAGTKNIYPKDETFALFGYHTRDITDPGRFVSIA
jgi:hypothetical protein